MRYPAGSVFGELRCSRLSDAQIRVVSDEHLAGRVVVRSVMAEQTEQVDEKAGLGVASLHAVGAGEPDVAALEILANLGGGSELPLGNSAFPVEDTGGRLRQSCSEVEYGVVLLGTDSGDWRHF